MKQRKNILFLTNRVPFPPDKGDKIRTFHQMDCLALSHNVYCACFVDCRRDISHVRSVRRWCMGVIARRWTRPKALLRTVRPWLLGSPFTTAAYSDRTMRRQLAEWAKRINFDVAVAFSSSMAPYALAVPAKRRVLDLCDADSQKWLDYARDSSFPMSSLYRAEGRRLGEYEKTCLEQFDALILITDRERKILDPRQRHPKIFVIPNGTTICAGKPPLPSECGPVVGFLGAMDYRPNADGIGWFVQDVWPRVLAAVPDARLQVVGRHPTRRVKRLARVEGVEVVGEVDDVRKYLSGFRVMVAPLQVARGLQNKVLEGMAMQRPVVATSAVAGGLHVEPGHNILVADDAEAFAEKVIDLCCFDEFCDKIGRAGYRSVATHYTWAEALQRYEKLVLGETSKLQNAKTPRQEKVKKSKSQNVERCGRPLSTQQSALSTQLSALSTQHSALLPQSSVLSPQSSVFSPPRN